jgi:hypothetical protein
MDFADRDLKRIHCGAECVFTASSFLSLEAIPEHPQTQQTTPGKTQPWFTKNCSP